MNVTFISRHTPTQAQEKAASVALGRKITLIQRDIVLQRGAVPEQLKTLRLRPFETVAMVAPPSLLEETRRTGRPVLVFESSTRGMRVDQAPEIVAHVLCGLYPALTDQATSWGSEPTLVEVDTGVDNRWLFHHAGVMA